MNYTKKEMRDIPGLIKAMDLRNSDEILLNELYEDNISLRTALELRAPDFNIDEQKD